ncbi:MAG: glutathione S-transferase family protein [Alphaproteobacteria bacterium]
MTTQNTITIFGDGRSGNCHKVRLICELTEQPFQWQEVDVLSGDTRRDDFLKLNPNGRLPTMRRADGTTLWESNAILFELAQNTPWWPADPRAQSATLQWMFFEQYSHEPFIAVNRFIQSIGMEMETRAAEYQANLKKGAAALHVMEQHLLEHAYLGPREEQPVETPSIADICLYAYTHVAHEGGFDLGNFPGIRFWLTRLEMEHGFERMG